MTLTTPDFLTEYDYVVVEHHIKQDPSVLLAVNPPRRISLLLNDKVKNELDRMPRLEFISKAEEPTE